MITSEDRDFIHMAVWAIVTQLRRENSQLTPGEIYDAIAAELEMRCQEIIERPR